MRGDDAVRSDSIARNAAYSLVVQVATAAFTAALTLFLVNFLSRSEYGVISLAFSIGGLLVVPSDFGISHSAGRFAAEAGSARASVARVVGDALKLKLLVSTPVAAVLFATAAPIASAYGDERLTWPLRAIAIAVLAQGLFLFFSNVFVSLGRVSRSLGLVCWESAAEAGGSVALVLLGGGAAGAAFGRAAGYAFGAVLGLVLTVRMLDRSMLSRRAPERALIRKIAVYAGVLAVVDGVFTLYSQLGGLLIGGFVGVAAVGLYNAPMRLLVLTQYPGLALANAIAPRLGRDARAPSDVAAFAAAVRVLVALGAGLVVFVVVWADPIVDVLLPRSYSSSATVLRVLAPYVFLTGLGPLLSLGVNYLGDARRRLPIALLTAALTATVDAALIPRLGVAGAAVGADVGYLLYVPAHLWICRHMIGLPLRPIAATFARSAVAGAALAAVLFAVGTDSLSPLAWLTGIAGGGAAFVAVLAVAGERLPLRALAHRR